MPTKTTTLTDVAEGVWHDAFELRESGGIRLAGGNEWSIRKRTLRGGVSDGVDVVDLNNGALAVSIMPTRGMSLWRGHYRGLDLGWNSPVQQPVNPCYVNQTDRNGLGWLTGFNELLCRCGLSSNGSPGMDVIVDNTGHTTEAPLTLHGKIANLPAHFVEVSVSTKEGGLMSVTGVVDETMMFGPGLRLTTTYETVPNSNRLTIRDMVVNIAARPMELELLYHTNFGKPFLEKGTRLVLPFREVAPRDSRAAEDTKKWQTYLGPTPGYTEQCYFADLVGDDADKTLVLLRNSAGDRGVSLEYSIRELPCFTVWKCTQPEADGYVTGLEPATNLPNLKTFERKQGRVVTLSPGASHSAQIELSVHASRVEVEAVEKRIGELQNRTHPIVHERPIGKYSPT
jgi:Domain of unknown function (DUF4432)